MFEEILNVILSQEVFTIGITQGNLELFCTTIRPKISSLMDLFLLFACKHSTKIYDPLSFVLSLFTTNQAKIRVLINLFALFVHDHSTKN